MSKKLSFLSLVSLVIGSQIGSGVFLLPASLALLGPISLFGWLISGTGAILLALVFAQLCMRVSKGGGPHVYIEKAFGRRAAFFTAWTYWLVSWVSSIAVIVAAIGYLSPMIGSASPLFNFFLQILILGVITWINLRGTAFVGSMEVVLTLFKCIPLILIPLVALFAMKIDYFFPLNPTALPLDKILNKASLLTFWGFIGLETATVSAGSIENPAKTIPKAVILGTLIVGGIYLLSSLGVMGVVEPTILSHSSAPYVDAAKVLFGGGWNLAIAFIAFIACIGTLNAWVLTSGQIAKEAAIDGLFPSCFAKTNRFGAPHVGILIAFGCTIPLLGFTLTPDILAQLGEVIDLSVTIFLFVYLACVLALIKISFAEKKKWLWMISLFALAFCTWILSFVKLKTLLVCSLFIFSGLPVYWRQFKQKKFVQS